MKSLCLAVLLAALPLHGQAAGVDLVLSTGSVQYGVPCAPFSQASHFPFVAAGELWSIQARTQPLTAHFLLFGPPPTSSRTIPGIENLLLVHDPVVVVLRGVTGPPDPASACGQGSTGYSFLIPTGISPGSDFAMQLLGLSSTTGNWAFSTNQWITIA